jgi:hypothetical protein
MEAQPSPPEKPSDASAQIAEKLRSLTATLEKLERTAAEAKTAATKANDAVDNTKKGTMLVALFSGGVGSVLGALLTAISTGVIAQRQMKEQKNDATRVAKINAQAIMDSANRNFDTQLALVQATLENSSTIAFEQTRSAQYAEDLKKVRELIGSVRIGLRESASDKKENTKLSQALVAMSPYAVDDKFQSVHSLRDLHDEAADLTGAYHGHPQAWQYYNTTMRAHMEELCDRALLELNAWAHTKK